MNPPEWFTDYWNPQPEQWIPIEYQGWVFIGMLVVGFACVLYTFWLIANDKKIGRKV